MRFCIIPAQAIPIPMFAETSPHPAAPLGHRTAGERSEGQGRPPAGACASPLTAVSMRAGWGRCGGRAACRYAVLLLSAMLLSGAMSGIGFAQSAPVRQPAGVDPYAAHIAEAAQRFGIPELWIRAVLRAESAGDMRATSAAGAMGLMQVMPETWVSLRIRHGLGVDPYDPRDNILAGAAYLREMWDRYSNVAAMLAAYNAGPGRYDEYLATGRILPAETRSYVASLAPTLGSATATVAPPRPLDWRDAPLFVMQPDGTATVAEASGDAQTGGLFVAMSQQARP